jgi:D-amino-acid dehydrogenase
MKVAVIGSGLIGATSAYFLRQRGCEVTVIERQQGSGLETSFANGALLTPSMSEPWNTPGSWRVLLGSLGTSAAPLQLRARALPSLFGWGVQFLRNSRAANFERNTRIAMRLALYSQSVMASLRCSTGIEYGRSARGALRLFRSPTALENAARAANQFAHDGLRFRILSTAEVVDAEPALAPIAGSLAGAIHYEADETGDAHRFCVALTQEAQRQGVEFLFGTGVTSLEVRSGAIRAVLTDSQRVVADRYVVAAGSYSVPLLRLIGIRLPVRPAKGYSLTFEDTQGQPSLSIPVIDDYWHAAVVPLEGAIRVAGTAEFAGFDRSLDPRRVRVLASLLQNVLPHARLDPASARPWCGLRPMSVDGVPLIGATSIRNLIVSTGHGHLGWTMAAGSAELLADLISGKSPAIDPAPYDPRRFIEANQRQVLPC